jgi:hypothetical protein
LIHSSAYHPQTDGQTERVNQILEDMLRACVMEHPGSWDKNLTCAEFSYNNSYQECLKMAPFEVLYRRCCRTPLNWIEPGEKVIFGPNIVDDTEATVHHIQDNLRAAKSRQKSYANKMRRPLEFEFPICGKCETVAYKLELPPTLAIVHDIFHVSRQNKCLKALVDVVLP